MAFTTDIVSEKLVMTHGAESQRSLLNCCNEVVRKKKKKPEGHYIGFPDSFIGSHGTEIKARKN